MSTRAHDGPDQVAALRTELTQLTERLARAEQTLAQRRPARRPGRGGRWLAAALLAILLATTPLALFAASPFTDLNPESAHNADIDLIYRAGITQGCVPNRRYCPNASVTQEQLATYIARTAGLGTHSPVANARTAVHAQSAANATTLQGHGLSDFLLSTGDMQLRYSFMGSTTDDNATFAHSPGPTTTVIPGAPEFMDVFLPLDVPVQMFEEELRVQSFEVCYEMDGGAFIFQTELLQGASGQADLVVRDTTQRPSSSPDCYTVTLNTPAPITGALYLRVNLWIIHTSNRPNLYSVRLVLRPFAN